MRKVVYICDKCKKAVDPAEIIKYEEGVDLCRDCSEKAMDLIKAWISVVMPEPEPEPEQEPQADPVPESVPEKEVKKAKKAPAKKEKKEIDAGAAQAMRNAGWTITKIAEELGCSKTEIHRITHKPAEKKRFVNEWAENEPDLKTDIRIETGEIKPIES